MLGDIVVNVGNLQYKGKKVKEKYNLNPRGFPFDLGKSRKNCNKSEEER